MPHVLIQPGDPLEIIREELEPLADELRARGFEVELSDRERVGYAVTYWEVFHFFLDETAEHAIDGAIGAFLVWVRMRFKKAREDRASRAPKSLTIYGPDKKPLRKVTIKRDEEPEIEVVSDYGE